MFLYLEDEKMNLKNKNLINICMALDNNIIYPTLVSMTSALENNKNNVLAFFLLLSDDFRKENIKIFESLKNYYHVIINYYVIPNIFGSLKTWRHGTHCHYHKIIIPILFPYLERILYLDSDTLIFQDLSKMYSLYFNHNFILASQAHDKYIMNKFNIKLKVLINVGVILFNIRKIRKDNKDIELLYFIMKNSKKLKYPEQDSMNIVFNPNIGILPYSYGMRIIDSLNTYKKYCEPAYIIKYSINEIKNALLNPAIVHLVYCSPKIWNRLTKSRFKNDTICFKYQKQFYFYAKKTKYFSKIYDKLYKKN
jgi:lipopolysaccharide biosynthesis glycosyltransferase